MQCGRYPLDYFASKVKIYNMRNIFLLGLILFISCGFTGRAPSEIVPLFPEDKSQWNMLSIQITWKCENADNYQIFVSNDSLDMEMVSEQTASVYEMEDMLQNTWYYWKVIAINSSGETSTGVLSFKTGALPEPVDSLIFPRDGQTHIDPRLPVEWISAEFATSYNVEIATDSFFVYIVSIGNATDTIFEHDELEMFKTYYWHVQSVNFLGIAEWSHFYSFTTGKYWP